MVYVNLLKINFFFSDFLLITNIMQTKTLTNNNSSLMIHYNDKTVKIEPDQPLNIKWINGKNGLKSVEPKKVKHLNLDVPVVSFRRVERLSKSGIARSFKMPTPYVCCAMEEEETNRNETEYDLDREDLTWLQMANARRHKAKRPSIDECTLERAIDMLEKESHFQFTQGEHGYDLGYLTMIDNDAPCCICNDGEDSNANQIIFCDICNIAVHQECYGVPYIPEGQWLCRRCQMSPSIPVDCALCSCTSGAFKQTSDGRWAHVVCAIWLNEVHFGNTVFLEPVEGVGFSIKRRRKLTCLICKRKVGACLQCSNKACVRSFHATCARYAGMKMVVKESRARNNADSITINRFAYCFQHSNPNRSGQTMASWKREMENNIKEARKMLDIKAKQTLKSVPVPVIPKEKVEDIAQKLGLNYVNDIYSYWSLKRKSRFGVPLIRRLQVYMNQQKPLFSGIPFDQNGGVDVDEAVVAAESSSAPPPLEEIQSGPATTTTAVVVVDPLKRYAALRRNFERVRLLCELVKKREKMKHEQLLTNRAIVCKTMKPLAVLIDQTLAKLIEKDHQKIFAQPVTEKQVPGYFATVSRPMDFKRMGANNEKGRYKRIADLRDDFLLMIQNCTSFNKDNLWFYNYGQRFKRIGMSVIKAAEIEEQRMNEVSSMVRQAIELPILSNEAYINLCFEVDFHNNKTAHGTEPMVDTTFSEASTELLKDDKSISHEPTIGDGGHQVHTASSSLKEFDGQPEENKPKKTDRCSSVRRATVAGKSDAEALGRNVNKRKIALDQGGKQNSSKKFALSNSVAKKDNSLSGQETISKKGKLNRTMNRGRASVGKQHTDINGGVKETTTVHATEEGRQMVVDCTPQQMRTTRVRGNTDENGHSKTPVKAPRVPSNNNVQNKYMALRMNVPFLMQQKNNSFGGGVAAGNRGRGVCKQTYASAYQTEASSAAESDSGNCDDIFFSSITEEEELSSTLTERKAAVPRRVGGGGGGVHKKFLEFGDTFVSSSPSSFAHNDIVRVDDSKFPGRVIDIRMRAIDLEDEEDDDVDGVGGGRSSFGVGRHFIDYALATKPKENETGQQPFTLILFFDKNSTCKWVPNGQIRLLYELDLNNALLHREKDQMVEEAFERARRFWKKVIHF